MIPWITAIDLPSGDHRGPAISRVGAHDVEPGDPVVVGSRSFDGLRRERRAVRRPVVVVDVHVGGADFPYRSAREIDDRNALLLHRVADDSGVGLIGDERTGALRGSRDEEDRELLAVRRPLQLRELAFHARHAAGRTAAVGVEQVDLLLRRRTGVRQKRDRMVVW
jgi:hypothetical protein